MNSQEGQNKQDDGFQSDDNQRLDQLEVDPIYNNQNSEQKQRIINDNKRQPDSQRVKLPPGQSLISGDKKYSLFPDIATGWMPKDNKCHPIPITVQSPGLDALYDKIYHKNSHMMIKGSQNEDGKPQNYTKNYLDNQNTNKNAKSNNQNHQNNAQPQFQSPKLPHSMIVCYFGPRYDNTYYSWHQMPFQFPYTHIEPPTNMKFTNRPFSGQHPMLHHFQPNVLVFDSFFENGNLDCVIKVGQLQYDLYLRVDSNTRGHFQWYNFIVKNMVKNTKYRFNICNLQKQDSLYQRGMKPYIFSYKAKQKVGRDWLQDGQNIKYEKKISKSSSILYSQNNNQKLGIYYKLSFEYSTSYENDTIQMAYCIPYTYTDLVRYLNIKRRKYEDKKYYTQSRLCLSLGGLPVPLITIHQQQAKKMSNQENCLNQNNLRTVGQTNQHSTQQAINLNANKSKKKCILISCRVHPGQSNSSYVMQGLIDFLCSNKPSAKILRTKVIFKIVPMINPDGVCFGNYRTGLSGKDFNRQYLKPDSRLHPEVYHFKKLVADYKKKYGNNFLMFLDFHGHSVRKNVFMYGPENSIMQKYYYESRILPRILSKKTQMFRYYSCIFKIQESKKTTARSIFQQTLNIPLSYTIEASNGSYYNTQILKDFPFTSNMWIQMGIQLGNSISQYVNLLAAAQRARLQKYRKIEKLNSNFSIKQQNNIRTSKLIQRKKQRRKAGGQKFEDFHYGKVLNYMGEQDNYDEDLFKYIYEQIQQAQNSKRSKTFHRTEANKFFQQQQNLIQGNSDKQDEQNDLEPEKLELLHSIIKSKKYSQQNTQKIRQPLTVRQKSKQDKQLLEQFKSQLVASRSKSAMGVNQQQYFKKLSQPKKSSQAIINLSFQNYLHSNNDIEPMYIIGTKNSRVMQMNKRNPITFQEFVTTYQKWQRFQKSEPRPVSAINSSSITQGGASKVTHHRNNSTNLQNRKYIYQTLMKKKISGNENEKNCTIMNINKYEYDQKQIDIIPRRRLYSPTKLKHSYIKNEQYSL